MAKEKNLKYYTYQFDMKILNLLAILLFILVGGFVWWLKYPDTYQPTMPFPTLLIIALLWLLLHELLHGLGFSIFKSVKKENITFGLALEKGVFYCMCKQNIKKPIILTSLLFPVTIIGMITLIVGMLLNQYELVFLSILNIVSSIGDIMMTIYFLKCPNDIIYLDLDDCTSFTVLSTNSLETIKVPGINLIKKGIYNKNKMIAKDKRKLVVSKPSYILIIIIIVIALAKLILG